MTFWFCDEEHLQLGHLKKHGHKQNASGNTFSI